VLSFFELIVNILISGIKITEIYTKILFDYQEINKINIQVQESCLQSVPRVTIQSAVR